MRTNIVLEVRRAIRKNRRLQPKTLLMPNLTRMGIIGRSRPAVHHVIVVNELHVTGAQLHLHVMIRIVSEFDDSGDCGFRERGEARGGGVGR